MRMSGRDLSGLALAGVTVVLLALHGGDRHAARDVLTSSATAGRMAAPAMVAFVDVNLVSSSGAEPRSHQVVLVRAGVVSAIGPVGQVEAPAGTFVVEGNGSKYLMHGTAARTDGGDGPVASETIAAGAPADFVLFAADPRTHEDARLHPEGVMEAGSWHPSDAVEPGVARRVQLLGGH